MPVAYRGGGRRHKSLHRKHLMVGGGSATAADSARMTAAPFRPRARCLSEWQSLGEPPPTNTSWHALDPRCRSR